MVNMFIIMLFILLNQIQLFYYVIVLFKFNNTLKDLYLLQSMQYQGNINLLIKHWITYCERSNRIFVYAFLELLG